MFAQLDVDHDGVLTLEEIGIRLSDIGARSEDIERAMMIMDEDGSGGITKQEFINTYAAYLRAATAFFHYLPTWTKADNLRQSIIEG